MNLQALYEQPQHVQFLRSRYFVEGAITGACASPEIPMPDTWLPWTVSARPQLSESAQSAEQTELIFDQLFGFFKETLASMNNQRLKLPSYAEYRSLNDTHELSEYCSGLMLAHQSSEKLWASAWKQMQAKRPEDAPALAKDLKHCLLVFTTFADPQTAIEQAEERGEHHLQEKLPIIAQSLHITLQQYVYISGKLAGFLPNQFETFVQQAD